MDFVAIDFETANEKRNSPCSIGIVVVKGGEVVEKLHYLIRPQEMRFMPINIGIHGIRPAMVKDAPEFPEVWEKIKNYFPNSTVVAHNASFDISVLRKTAELYDIELPSFQYICTMKLAKNFYLGLQDAKLNTVNDFLDYKFIHHDALYDALACSNILLKVSEELKTTDIQEVADITGLVMGYVDCKGYSSCSLKGRAIRTSNKTYYYKRENNAENYNREAFKNEVVVFTGKLNSMSRDQAMTLVRRLGGATGGTVTKKTTILVTNMKNIQGLRREEMSTKLRKATDYKAKGQDITLLNEEEFLEMRYSRTGPTYTLQL
ncbi:exonuclease domain-containing protein [Alloiococcus sp. CFN-8]|uniref:exonuclease domain-containing protein n=1 Tax=Alloiococcus sp. CFN-8 TaxID=3416081 RepID=UPI003CEA2E50